MSDNTSFPNDGQSGSSVSNEQPLGFKHAASPVGTLLDDFDKCNRAAFIGYLPYGFPIRRYPLTPSEPSWNTVWMWSK
jgi:hypothetical protein